MSGVWGVYVICVDWFMTSNSCYVGTDDGCVGGNSGCVDGSGRGVVGNGGCVGGDGVLWVVTTDVWAVASDAWAVTQTFRAVRVGIPFFKTTCNDNAARPRGQRTSRTYDSPTFNARRVNDLRDLTGFGPQRRFQYWISGG